MDLPDRMKNYEKVAKFYLTRRTPVIIRVDGKAFHSWTKDLKKPFDILFINSMTEAARNLMGHMQGCKLAYVQSDEASFFLADWDSLETEAWFGNNLQKMASVASSIMTAAFNRCWENRPISKPTIEELEAILNSEEKVPIEILPNGELRVRESAAFFDARAFQLPREEIANYFLWRMQDWHRNSLQMYARHFFSHKECHKKNHEDLHEMLHTKGKNWTTDLSGQKKNGTFIYKNVYEGPTPTNPHIFDHEILPTFEAVNELVERVLKKQDALEFQGKSGMMKERKGDSGD